MNSRVDWLERLFGKQFEMKETSEVSAWVVQSSLGNDISKIKSKVRDLMFLLTWIELRDNFDLMAEILKSHK